MEKKHLIYQCPVLSRIKVPRSCFCDSVGSGATTDPGGCTNGNYPTECTSGSTASSDLGCSAGTEAANVIAAGCQNGTTAKNSSDQFFNPCNTGDIATPTGTWCVAGNKAADF